MTALRLAGALTLGAVVGLGSAAASVSASAPASASAGRKVRRARVSIESRPPAPLRVYVNGRRFGTTPIANAPIRPGRYLVEAIRPDGARIKRVMRFRPAQDAKLVFVD